MKTSHVLYGDDGVIVAEVGAICVVIWRKDVVEHRFREQATGLAQVVRNHRGGDAAFLCIIESTCRPPDDQLRRASIDMVAAHDGDLSCVACVVEGSGFRAAVGRSVLSGMSLIFSGRKAPVSVFASVPSAVDWMSERCRVSPALPATVERLRLLFESNATQPSKALR